MTPAQARAVALRPRLQQLGLSRELADQVLVVLREDLVAAESWRSYWNPREIAYRLDVERAAQDELAAAEWAPVAAHVHRLAGRVARGEVVPPPLDD